MESKRRIGIVRPSLCCAYVASRASIPERSEMWRRLRSEGSCISSTWIDEAAPGQTKSMSELWQRIQEEIRQSTHLVLYVERADLPLKGALIEAGMALAMGLEVRIVERDFSGSDDLRRLLGSWIKHPLVVFFSDVRFAVNQPPEEVNS